MFTHSRVLRVARCCGRLIWLLDALSADGLLRKVLPRRCPRRSLITWSSCCDGPVGQLTTRTAQCLADGVAEPRDRPHLTERSGGQRRMPAQAFGTGLAEKHRFALLLDEGPKRHQPRATLIRHGGATSCGHQFVRDRDAREVYRASRYRSVVLSCLVIRPAGGCDDIAAPVGADHRALAR